MAPALPVTLLVSALAFVRPVYSQSAQTTSTSLLLFNIAVQESTVSTSSGFTDIEGGSAPTFDASVVTANPTATAFALACATPTDSSVSGQSCAVENATVTAGPSTYVSFTSF